VVIELRDKAEPAVRVFLKPRVKVKLEAQNLIAGFGLFHFRGRK